MSDHARRFYLFFFFQAEDGIRDGTVTGVQTCALPILSHGGSDVWQVPLSRDLMPHFEPVNGRQHLYVDGKPFTVLAVEIPWWDRSEERRVGKECRSRRSPYY